MTVLKTIIRIDRQHIAFGIIERMASEGGKEDALQISREIDVCQRGAITESGQWMVSMRSDMTTAFMPVRPQNAFSWIKSIASDR